MRLSKLGTLPLVPSIITAIAFCILVSLGLWQLQRGEEKQELVQKIRATQELPPTALTNSVVDAKEMSYRTFLLTGKVARETLFYWDNRIVQGQVGYQIIVPVRSNLGWLLVDFGWVKGTGDRQRLPDVVLPEALSEAPIKLWRPLKNKLIQETLSIESPWPKLVQEINVPLLEAHFGEQVLPVVAVMDRHTGGFVSNYKPVVLPPEKHLAYAIQWFGLAIAVLVVFIVAVRTKNDGRSS